jgi:hypothetical protein
VLPRGRGPRHGSECEAGQGLGGALANFSGWGEPWMKRESEDPCRA